MKSLYRLVMIWTVLVLVNFAASVPSLAQQDEAAALNEKLMGLFKAGKYAEAIPVAQRLLAIREKAKRDGIGDRTLRLNVTPASSNRWMSHGIFSATERRGRERGTVSQ
jgi:hypothetical protein